MRRIAKLSVMLPTKRISIRRGGTGKIMITRVPRRATARKISAFFVIREISHMFFSPF
jgi:hypothetical protein